MTDDNCFISTQQLLIRDINQTAFASLEFIEGVLSVSVCADGKQFDFDVQPETLLLLTDAYKRHIEQCEKEGRL